jgi:hypothetical protein
MIELLLFPATFFAARLLLTETAARLLTRKLTGARHAAVHAVNELFATSVLNVSVNVAVLLVTVYGLRGRLAHDQLVLVISTVYAASVLHAGLKLLTNGYWIWELSRFLLRHGIHGPKAWLRARITRDVEAHFQNMGVWRRIVYRFSDAPRPRDLVEMLTREIWALVTAKLVMLLAVMALYVVVFSLHTRPLLVEEATHLNWLQAFFWPFGYSMDIFFGTNLTAWIESQLQF